LGLFLLFGLNNGIIDREQYTILVTGVILSAVLPTLVAQQFFQPTVESAAMAGPREEVVDNV